jgi:two-component system response regulator DesR
MDTPASLDGHLRVLLFGNAGVASTALTAWLSERERWRVFAPVGSTAEIMAATRDFRPHVVLLDFHGLPVSTGYTISQIKAFSPPPVVYMLTHDATPAMLRRCLEAKADGVFDKTGELDRLDGALGRLEESFRSVGQ